MLCYLRSHVPWESWKRLFSWSQDIQLRPPSSQERKEKALCLYTSLLNCCLRTTGELRQKLAFLDKLVLPSDSCTDSPAYPCHGNVQTMEIYSSYVWDQMLLFLFFCWRCLPFVEWHFFHDCRAQLWLSSKRRKRKVQPRPTAKQYLICKSIHFLKSHFNYCVSFLLHLVQLWVLRQRCNRNSTLWQWKYSFSKLKGVLTLTMSLKASSALFCV